MGSGEAPEPPPVDFLGGRFGWRWRRGGGLGQALARAVGLRPGRPRPEVVDATAGLGRDAFLLAVLGCRVVALERCAALHAALVAALDRALADPEAAAALGGRLRFLHADARAWLAALAPGERPQVVLVDPMHPPRGKSALVRREMRLLRALVGDDPDAAELLAAARAAATARVVVKRPRHAPPLAPSPNHAVRGRSTRFDVYLTGSGG
ncbi:MAG: 16S rRNA methyltransferase [Planctomycetota bacterium]|nr:MAG: 16S rRNA methyltransferase [Planctomycetota bacterium]